MQSTRLEATLFLLERLRYCATESTAASPLVLPVVGEHPDPADAAEDWLGGLGAAVDTTARLWRGRMGDGGFLLAITYIRSS